MEPKKTFSLEIVRPTGVFCQKTVTMVVFPAPDGERAVLAHHAPFLSVIGMGTLRVLDENKQWSHFWVEGGFVETTKQGHVYILPQNVMEAKDIQASEVEKTIATIEKTHLTPSYPRKQRDRDLHRARLMLKTAKKI